MQESRQRTERAMTPKTVLVFGTFDGLHDGHRFLLREAKKLGDLLIASVAQDSTVERFKKRKPVHALAERIQILRKSGLVDDAVPGDTELGRWTAVKEVQPAIIALGYDQSNLEEKLREFITEENLPIVIKKIPPFDGDRLHSRLLRKD